jgi:hypothetical protein
MTRGGLEEDLAKLRELCPASADRIEMRLRIMQSNLERSAEAGRKMAAKLFEYERAGITAKETTT